ncbi:MAG: hypothetical protein ACRD1K_04840 [Acidimicrobiales bacterium]
MSLAEVARAVVPVTLAGDRRLRVAEPFEALLAGGLQRGTVVAVEGRASTSVALALAAGASSAGSWCGVVGRPALGVVAAADLGCDLARLVIVPEVSSGGRAGSWPWVVATLLEALDVVLAWPPGGGVRAADARRLAVRARERGSVLVVVQPAEVTAGETSWPIAADLRLGVTGSRWVGVDAGHGHLQARSLQVSAHGRGAAARERTLTMWLPGPPPDVRCAAPEPAETSAVTSEMQRRRPA